MSEQDNSTGPFASGGKTVYGATVGILMLDTIFPRVPGDVGNAATWPFPVLYHVVQGASPQRVVCDRAEGLLDAFVEAGRQLVAQGADGLTTTCGFLALFQEPLSRAVKVPVASSSLMQVPLVQQLLPDGRRVGVMTISSQNLSVDHLRAAGAPEDTPVIGTENGREFSRCILENRTHMDLAACRLDLLESGRQLLTEHPDIGAVVLECTNMGPYAADLRRELGVPVFSAVSFISWFQSGLLPRAYTGTTADPRLS